MMTEIQKVSYSLGISIAQNLKQQGLTDMDTALFAQAIKDVMNGGDLQIPATEVEPILNAYFGALQDEKFSKNIDEANAFLAENSKKEGITTLESGLQYEVLVKGDGPIPTAEDNVTTHYHGTLLSGDVFDSSVTRGEPATFPVGGVIKGWVEALQLMPVGSKWKIYVPSELAYGANPHPNGPIEPHMALVFEIELLEIAK